MLHAANVTYLPLFTGAPLSLAAQTECAPRSKHLDLCIGVPVSIGKNGFEDIVEIDLNKRELEMFKKSVEAVKETNSALDGLI